jgi:polyhydroxybutyrate depolymerase
MSVGRERNGFTLLLLFQLAAACGEEAGGSAPRTSAPSDDAGRPASNDAEPGAADDHEGPTAGDGAPQPTTLLETVMLEGFPHSIDVYATAGAERGIVMLHGGGGTNQVSAMDLGVNAGDGAATETSIDWDRLAEHKVVALFPQGQSVPGAPNAFTWTNRVMDSGQDDVAFLEVLARYVRDEYNVASVYLIGHSNGGMMANRMWCESPATFDAYVAIAGPASSDYLDEATPCTPDLAQPYLGIVGDGDVVLGVPGSWESTTWEISPILTALSEDAFVNPVLIGEWTQQQRRSELMCGDQLSTDDAQQDGATETWSTCNGLLRLQRIRGGAHPIETLEAAGDFRILDVVNAFFDAL